MDSKLCHKEELSQTNKENFPQVSWPRLGIAKKLDYQLGRGLDPKHIRHVSLIHVIESV